MLYKKNLAKELDTELFKNPTKEYKGTPFWGWNSKPDEAMLTRQMEELKEMGFGGFHVHSRTGLDVPYLSDEFMNLIKYCADYAKAHDMMFWAYDEDRFPSGFAGGIVTKNKKFRSRQLFLTAEERPDYLPKRPEERAEESYLIQKFDIVLDEEGCLKSYLPIADGQEPKGTIWYAYNRVAEEDSWFNNQTYVDTLYKPAMERFVEVTHERYKEYIGEYFDDITPSFFTDEPKVTYKKSFPFPDDKRNLIFPWTDDFPDTFEANYHDDIVAKIPELFWELPEGKMSTARYYYHRHVMERFRESYSGTIGSWCDKNKVYMTGHMIKEPSLRSQSTSIGETMAPMGPFGLPGIDMLCDEREYTTAKQAQSVEHQYGREGVVSEMYGVTNWDFDFRGHKLAGDWQAVLGVTVRIHHLSLMTLEGEAKRDYPASIHYQSPWYKEYSLIEDHFARVNTAMTRGKAIERIGVLHPVESYWMCWGTESQTAGVRKQLDENFQRVTEWLLFDHMDFDYLSETIMADLGTVKDGKFKVGDMGYDVVLVPGCKTLRQSTLQLLRAFQLAGGKIVFAGEIPSYVNAQPSVEVKELAQSAQCISMERQAILDALEPYREVKIMDKNGNTCNKLLYQLREDGDCRWLFVAYGKKKARYDIEGQSSSTICVQGLWEPEVYDTMTGDIYSCSYEHRDGKTFIPYSFYVHDSLLLKLGKVKSTAPQKQVAEHKPEQPALLLSNPNAVKVRLSEPNVCLLDIAEYAVDDEPYAAEEEILRAGQIIREICGLPVQSGKMAQPWTREKKAPEHTCRLRYRIESKVGVPVSLALESADIAEIYWNGEHVDKNITGWYIDEKIQTVELPDVKVGENTLELVFPMTEETNMEACMLLGDFGVQVAGSKAVLTEPVRTLAFGDIVHQGLAFYGGNVTYQLEVEVPKRGLTIRAPYYKGSLIGVSVDGVRKGSIVFAPYQYTDAELPAGKHLIELTLFGNRINTLGALHNCNENCTWFGPDAYRSKGDGFAYEYQFRRVGILKAPEIR